MENIDLSELFSSELKAGFKKSKKFVYLSILVGIVFGIALGISNFQDPQTGYNTTGSQVWPLVGYIIQPALGLGFGLPLLLILAIFLYTVFWFPSIVAKQRGHAYTSLIQILNIAGLFTGVTWFIAAAWAIFPSEKSLIDPIVGNVTGLGRRNAGDTIGSAKHGSGRGAGFEADTDSQIDKLIDMHSKGLINDEEFARKKREIIQRNY